MDNSFDSDADSFAGLGVGLVAWAAAGAATLKGTTPFNFSITALNIWSSFGH